MNQAIKNLSNNYKRMFSLNNIALGFASIGAKNKVEKLRDLLAKMNKAEIKRPFVSYGLTSRVYWNDFKNDIAKLVAAIKKPDGQKLSESYLENLSKKFDETFDELSGNLDEIGFQTIQLKDRNLIISQIKFCLKVATDNNEEPNKSIREGFKALNDQRIKSHRSKSDNESKNLEIAEEYFDYLFVFKSKVQRLIINDMNDLIKAVEVAIGE